MGYGFASCYVVFGWKEGNTMSVIDSNWAREKNIAIFTTKTFRDKAVEAIYGISCWINVETGFPEISEEERAVVEEVHAIVVEHFKDTNISVGKLGFFTAVDGDCDWPQRKYIPRDRVV